MLVQGDKVDVSAGRQSGCWSGMQSGCWSGMQSECWLKRKWMLVRETK